MMMMMMRLLRRLISPAHVDDFSRLRHARDVSAPRHRRVRCCSRHRRRRRFLLILPLLTIAMFDLLDHLINLPLQSFERNALFEPAFPQPQ